MNVTLFLKQINRLVFIYVSGGHSNIYFKMVMCKYFLRGNCRFGESCKNEHAYNCKFTKYFAPNLQFFR